MPEAAVAHDRHPVARHAGEVGPFVAPAHRAAGRRAGHHAGRPRSAPISTSSSTQRCRQSIRMAEPLDLPPRADRVARRWRRCASWPARNRPLTAMIGLGYHGTITPSVIRRNVLEYPAWYTAYTPYQPEISQGRLEALLNFQTMVADLTGLPTAGASLLDEATAVAEAMTLARRGTKTGQVLLLDADTLPQTIGVVRTRAARARASRSSWPTARWPRPLAEVDAFARGRADPGAQRPARLDRRAGGRSPTRPTQRGALVIAACDLLALTLTTPPGEWGADIAVGSSQRFGVPLFYGGPHAGFISVRERAGAQPARPAGRGVRGRRRRPGVPAGAADPRAAHPPGEGDLQHLHGAGAAGRHAPACTRSTTGPHGLRGIAAGDPCAGRPRWPATCRAAGDRGRPRRRSSTPCSLEVPGGAAEVVAARARAAVSTCGWSMPTMSGSRVGEDADRGRPRQRSGSAFGARPSRARTARRSGRQRAGQSPT